MKDGYEARISMQNAVLPPQTATPQYYFRPNITPPAQAKHGPENKQSRASSAKPQQLPVQSAHEVAIDINTNPYHQPQPKPDHYSSRVALDAKIMQAQSQFGASAVAMAAHRNVGTVQYGIDSSISTSFEL